MTSTQTCLLSQTIKPFKPLTEVWCPDQLVALNQLVRKLQLARIHSDLENYNNNKNTQSWFDKTKSYLKIVLLKTTSNQWQFLNHMFSSCYHISSDFRITLVKSGLNQTWKRTFFLHNHEYIYPKKKNINFP